MKTTYILLLACFFVISAGAQSVEKQKANVDALFSQLDSTQHLESDSKYSLIEDVNTDIAKGIVAYAEATPNFLQSTSKDSTFESITSDDKKLKIVYWDDAEGGSVRLYDYVVFWKKGNKLGHKIILMHEQEDEHASYINNISIDSIVHLKQKDGSDLYFIMGGTLSRPEYWQTVFCYKISTAGQLTTDAPVFEAGNKMLSIINVNCISYFNDKESMRGFYTLLHFSKDRRTLYVPIFPDKKNNEKEQEAEDADTTGQRKFSYFNYEFNGANFVYKKKQ